jgi:hypothetical protein
VRCLWIEVLISHWPVLIELVHINHLWPHHRVREVRRLPLLTSGKRPAVFAPMVVLADVTHSDRVLSAARLDNLVTPKQEQDLRKAQPLIKDVSPGYLFVFWITQTSQQWEGLPMNSAVIFTRARSPVFKLSSVEGTLSFQTRVWDTTRRRVCP